MLSSRKCFTVNFVSTVNDFKFKFDKLNKEMSLWLSSTSVFQKRLRWSIYGKGSGWIQIACSNNRWEKRNGKFYHHVFPGYTNIVRNRDEISIDTARAKFSIWPVMTRIRNLLIWTRHGISNIEILFQFNCQTRNFIRIVLLKTDWALCPCGKRKKIKKDFELCLCQLFGKTEEIKWDFQEKFLS